jgi:hypothetical protein
VARRLSWRGYWPRQSLERDASLLPHRARRTFAALRMEGYRVTQAAFRERWIQTADHFRTPATAGCNHS